MSSDRFVEAYVSLSYHASWGPASACAHHLLKCTEADVKLCNSQLTTIARSGTPPRLTSHLQASMATASPQPQGGWKNSGYHVTVGALQPCAASSSWVFPCLR